MVSPRPTLDSWLRSWFQGTGSLTNSPTSTQRNFTPSRTRHDHDESESVVHRSSACATSLTAAGPQPCLRFHFRSTNRGANRLPTIPSKYSDRSYWSDPGTERGLGELTQQPTEWSSPRPAATAWFNGPASWTSPSTSRALKAQGRSPGRPVRSGPRPLVGRSLLAARAGQGQRGLRGRTMRQRDSGHRPTARTRSAPTGVGRTFTRNLRPR